MPAWALIADRIDCGDDVVTATTAHFGFLRTTVKQRRI